MKTLWKSFLKDTCRYREVSENEKKSLSHYEHLQRYFPALDAFRHPENYGSQNGLELPSLYYLKNVSSTAPCSSITRDWSAERVNYITEESETCRVFMKVVHLIHPIDRIREKYTCPSHPLLPSSSSWKHTVSKLHHRNNQAYVDTIANFVLSRYREKNLLPNLIFYYGAYTAISKSYRYNITAEYESYRCYNWFWRGLKDHQSRITLVNDSKIDRSTTAYQRLYQDLTQPPSDDDLYSLSSGSSHSSGSSCSSYSSRSSNQKESDSIQIDDLDEIIDLQETIASITDLTLEEITNIEESKQEEQSISSLEVVSDDKSDTLSYVEDTDIFVEVPNIPVMMILQEEQEGSMDELLDLDDLDGHTHGTPEWEKRWIAWLFQIVATLTFLQNVISFTHNDLHTNNILWRKTDQQFLYYRMKGKTIWKIPTYGKIFSIIDFGRSIFRIGKHQWISDDHWPNGDAAGQYNYGPFFNKKQKKVEPNPSFDLCRLSVSLLSGLYDEAPQKKKGKHTRILSEEGSWKVYETQSALYNLLWKWTLDDSGKTVYENRHGEERYEGFDLYIHIAHHVHSAVPKEQLYQPLFQGFVWKQPVPSTEIIYGLDA